MSVYFRAFVIQQRGLIPPCVASISEEDFRSKMSNMPEQTKSQSDRQLTCVREDVFRLLVLSDRTYSSDTKGDGI